MSKRILNALMIAAFIMIAIGIIFAFVNLENIFIKTNNDGFVSAIFSLSGIILYFTALMYQIKEYKLQVKELRKSVEAQTKSSEALEEQKRILLEQNSNAFIFGMIEKFEAFKKRNDTDKIINEIVSYYIGLFCISWQEISNNNLIKSESKSEELAKRIQGLFETTIIGKDYYHILKNYIQFAYNILSLIDSNEIYMPRNNFKPFFFNQLNTNENIIIHLANLSNLEMPYYPNLHWDYSTTKEIVSLMGKNKNTYVRIDEIDCKILTETFIELKQRK